MIVTFIGDVHGWLDRLQELLPQCEGQSMFLGDLIDRGPDSAGVVALVRGLCERGRATAIMGNHEYALVRGLGCAALGIVGQPAYFRGWYMAYGGDATCRSYGVPMGDAPALAKAMAGDLEWLAGLPWALRTTLGRTTYLAVHAGLTRAPLLPQLAELSDPRHWWTERCHRPEVLYAKDRTGSLPRDFPSDWCLVSGHVPLDEALVAQRRILCDTSGGLSDRPLSAVIAPEGRVIASGRCRPAIG